MRRSRELTIPGMNTRLGALRSPREGGFYFVASARLTCDWSAMASR